MTAAAELTANRDADRFLGGGLGSLLVLSRLRTEQHFGQEGQLFADQTGDEANEQGGDDRTFAHAVEVTGQDDAQNARDDRHGHIERNLGHAKFGFPAENHCADEGFTGQHDDVGEYLHVHADAQHDTADEQIENLEYIGCRLNEEQEQHAQIDKIAENQRDRNLQQVFGLKIAPEDDELEHDE